MTWLGLDIGGANLKASDGLAWARSQPFPLWREPGGLTAAVRALIDDAPPAEQFAVTMTGELCDSFRTKAEGVRHILGAVVAAADGREVCVYILNGQFASPEQAAGRPRLAAASNWHALASFACRFTEHQCALLIDIGSTTTDIIPLVDAKAHTRGISDTERLCEGELVYTGVARTPICALTSQLPWRGRSCPVAGELFATTADAYVLLGEVPEQPGATWTADGRALTSEFARERLGRMLCADETEFDAQAALIAADYVRKRQRSIIAQAIAHATSTLPELPSTIIVSGSGEFLARQVAARAAPNSRVIALSEQLGPLASACAAAHAVATLARESARHE